MTKRTREERDNEVLALKAIKPKVRRYSMFRDDNWAAIDAQVRTVDEGLDEDRIYDLFGDLGELTSAGEAAVEAWRWTEGEVIDAPSTEWQELCV